MDIFSMILSLLCGVALFLFGMQLMGDGLKSVAGNKLETLLYKLTNTPLKGILLGTIVTSVIQSSSATSVMVIGFVNSGMMQLRQAIAIVFGSNIGTSVTGWILCLSYIDGRNGIAKILSSSTIAAVVAIAGILLRMLGKRTVHKNVGNIMMGFAVLMVGMQQMSGAVSPLRDSPLFINAITMFSNPILGILLGIVMTAILQSASASVGILQALSVTGTITFGIAFPMLLGIGVGSSAPVLISAIGANRNGQRTSLVYLVQHIFTLAIWTICFYGLNAVLHFPFINDTVNPVYIAAVNTAIRVAGAVLLFPFIGKMEELLCKLIKDSPEDLEDQADSADFDLLEERLLSTPAIALSQSRRVIDGMSRKVRKNVGRALNLIHEFSQKKYEKVQRKEDLIDKYESRIGSYLMLLSKQEMNTKQTRQVTMSLRAIGDLERIGDYASNIARITNEIHEENLSFSDEAMKDLNVMIAAEREIVNSSIASYQQNDLETAMKMKPLASAITSLCEIVKTRHIGRLTRGECSMQQGAAVEELLNSFERIASHCVAISGVVRREYQENPDYHVHSAKARELTEEEFNKIYQEFLTKYDVISNKERPLSVEAETVS
ncbi:MAG: Na/Pi cotransporter family protein [Blautia sp.]|nr:Na/Pi cotransporter family protein [Blautia sp.]